MGASRAGRVGEPGTRQEHRLAAGRCPLQIAAAGGHAAPTLWAGGQCPMTRQGNLPCVKLVYLTLGRFPTNRRRGRLRASLRCDLSTYLEQTRLRARALTCTQMRPARPSPLLQQAARGCVKIVILRSRACRRQGDEGSLRAIGGEALLCDYMHRDSSSLRSSE